MAAGDLGFLIWIQVFDGAGRARSASGGDTDNRKEPQETKASCGSEFREEESRECLISRLIPCSRPICGFAGGRRGRKQPSLRSQKAAVGAGNSKFWRSGAKIYLNLKAASLLARFNS